MRPPSLEMCIGYEHVTMLVDSNRLVIPGKKLAKPSVKQARDFALHLGDLKTFYRW